MAERLAADRILLIPTAIAPHKSRQYTGAEHRLEMLRLATQGDELFEISDVELKRSGKSYTIDTLMDLRRLYGSGVELIWVIGLDMLLDLGSWRRAKEVVDLARIVTAPRPPVPADLDERLAALAGFFSSEQVERLRRSILTTPLIDISATEIRRRAGQGLSIRYFVTEAVEVYIKEKKLYRTSK